MNKKSNGFTVPELLVTILILCLIAAFFIMNLIQYKV